LKAYKPKKPMTSTIKHDKMEIIIMLVK